MSQTLEISDSLYARLQAETEQRGFESIEQLIESWHPGENHRNDRKAAVAQIDALRERLFASYGTMSDSVNLIRDDRER